MPGPSDSPGSIHRPWKEIAHELAIEQDRQRMLELSLELNLAVEQQKNEAITVLDF